MANIYESANGWVSTLVNNALVKANVDKTLVGQIVEDSASSIGKYKVTIENATFYAYGNDKTLRNNDFVYILIPQGDFTQQKIILCKKFE